MAISWGNRILLLYLGFMLLIGTLVWKSTRSKVNLVADDYYEQELGFQKKLDAQQATVDLTHKPVISATPEAIIIFFPQEFAGTDIHADLHLYNPANAALDKTFTNLHAEEGKISIQREGLPATRYTAKLSWKSGGKSYYQEAALNISGK